MLAFSALALAACGGQEPAPSNQTEAASPVGPVKGVDRSHKGKPAPDVTIKDPDGGDITMADFKGVPVLVNLWATWCAPCVKELPTLDRLAGRYERDGDFGVITVSQDNGPQASVEAFLDKLKVSRLGAYHDPAMAVSGALAAEVLPTSILYDAQGREVWRYVGDFDWSSADAAKLLSEAGVPQKP